MRSLTIATDRVPPRRWWLVRIHPTVEHLRAAARRHRPQHDAGWWDDCVGCCSAAPDPLPSNGYAGMIRYAETHLTSEIVTHELVHAAAATYRMNVATVIDLGPECGPGEEDLAYIYGELYADLERKLIP